MSGRIRRAAAALGLHVARRRNYDLVPRNYYSPIPDESRLPGDIRQRRSAMRGIALDTGAQITWAERELAAFAGEFEAPAARDEAAGGFWFENPMYQYGDAEIAYAIVRRFKPRRVVELGSGFSTLVLAHAAKANSREGHPTLVETNDPFPSALVEDPVEGLSALRCRPAESIPVEELEGLVEGDVLFVDTTHVVRLGGDVNHIVLDVLPGLRKGVLVHFHDIWLPYEYHPGLTEHLNMHWTEQYLLQALLSGNPSFEILFATQAVATEQAERFRRLVPRFKGVNHPTSFWLQRR